MKKLDCILSNYRQKMAEPYIQEGSVILDLGGYDGSFLRRVYKKISKGVCIDPLGEEKSDDKIICIKQRITDYLPFEDCSFDVVCMLAVFEHFDNNKEQITKEVYRILKKGGISVLTVPHRAVDCILKLLITLRLLDGMSFEEHKEFNHKDTIIIFESVGFKLKKWVKFQIGLNNLFVFEK